MSSRYEKIGMLGTEIFVDVDEGYVCTVWRCWSNVSLN